MTFDFERNSIKFKWLILCLAAVSGIAGTFGVFFNKRSLPRNFLNIEMVWCPPGSFVMGSAALEAHPTIIAEDACEVVIKKGFWIGRYEVTQQQWKKMMGANPDYHCDEPFLWFFKLPRDQAPVTSIDWSDASKFCEMLTKVERDAGRLTSKFRYSLPSEEQWEYACRAGTETAYSFGNELNGKQANCDGQRPFGTLLKGPYRAQTLDVGSFLPNPWGIYDMHGNVEEWCESWCARSSDSEWFIKFRAENVPVRGGAWNNTAQDCRSAARNGYYPHVRSDVIGLRVVLIEE